MLKALGFNLLKVVFTTVLSSHWFQIHKICTPYNLETQPPLPGRSPRPRAGLLDLRDGDAEAGEGQR